MLSGGFSWEGVREHCEGEGAHREREGQPGQLGQEGTRYGTNGDNPF